MTGHACPSPGCTATVAASRLACRSHWYSIPKTLRNAIWRAWDNGTGQGTAAHLAAITAAIDYLKEAGQ